MAQLIPESLLYCHEIPSRELHRDHLFLFQMREEALAILDAHHAWRQVREMPMEFTKHGHVAQHVTEGVNSPTQAALD